MKLLDLDPQWLLVDGRRVGFTFVSPTDRRYRQSCFVDPPNVNDQVDLFDQQLGETVVVQPCNPSDHWAIVGGIEAADFATMTVTPSLDGSPGGLWHGHIKRGEIVGGI
jgi:hypothetical protein